MKLHRLLLHAGMPSLHRIIVLAVIVSSQQSVLHCRTQPARPRATLGRRMLFMQSSEATGPTCAELGNSLQHARLYQDPAEAGAQSKPLHTHRATNRSSGRPRQLVPYLGPALNRLGFCSWVQVLVHKSRLSSKEYQQSGIQASRLLSHLADSSLLAFCT